MKTRHSSVCSLLLLVLATAFLAGEASLELCGQNDDDTSYEVHTCQRTKATTNTRQLVHEWTIGNVSAAFSNVDEGNGVPYVLDSIDLDNKLGGNWTLRVERLNDNGIEVLFAAVFPLVKNGDDEETLNVIGGTASIYSGDGHTRKSFGCGTNYFVRHDNHSEWKGEGFGYFNAEQLTKIVEVNSIRVNLHLNLVYKRQHVEEFANGTECNLLRLDMFNLPTLPHFATKENDHEVPGPGATRMVRKHRVSLEWSIPTLSYEAAPIKDPGAGSGATSTSWLQEVVLPQGPQDNQWTTYMILRREDSGNGIQLLHYMYSRAEIRTTAPFRLAITSGRNCTKEVPQDGIIINNSLYRLVNFEVSDRDLEQWKHGIKVLVEYVVEYEPSPATTSTEAGNMFESTITY